MELDSEGLDSPVKVIACQEAGNSDVYEVEKITGMRLVKGKLWFRVRWKGYGADMATWEPRANLTHCEELLDDYVSKVQDKKYKQKKRRQTRNALIHSREKELKKGPNHVVKNRVPFNGPIRRKRFIRKFISKPNRCFKQMAQTKWPVNGGHLETVSATKLMDLPLETAKEKEPVDLPLETAIEKEPVDLPLETATEKEPVDLPLETATEKEPVDLLLETAKEKEQRRGGRARRRGRPKKNPVKMPDLQPQTQLCPDREPLETVDDIIILENNSTPEQKLETVVKRSRGRPPKRRITEQEEKLPVQSDLYGQERPKDIVRKRGRPKKVVTDEGVTKETTHHPYNGQIKLKKVVIRELRSLKALLEFQRQISDEEKENHTDTYPKEENPSTMENRHVLATEYRKRFYIRIKTGSFKDQSEKRRRKRKEHKEKRRKKKEAVQMKVRTDGDKEKNGLVDKQRVCDEIKEDKKERCRSPEMMDIGSSEVENRDEDSVESQLHAPALNEEYDQFGYDDFVDFSKENNYVRDKKEIEDDTDTEPLVPQVSEEMDIDGREMPRDEIVAIESDTVLSAPNLRPERLVEEDAVTKEEEKNEEEDEEEEARAADDESSSLVIPFDDEEEEEEEEEESSSLIICEDGMEDDDDDDDDDLREFEIENNANQEPQTAVTESFTTGSMDNVEKEITEDATRVDDQELTKAEHCEESSEDVDSDEFIIEEKLTNEETESKQKETEATNLEAMSSNDSLREEILSKLFERECNCGKNHEDVAHLDWEKDAVRNVASGKVVFTEEGSNKLDEKQDSHVDVAVEIVNDDQIEKGDANSGPNVLLETESEVQVFISAKDKIDIEDEESIRTSQMEEEECAKEVIKSGIISKTDNEEVDSLEGMETAANIERMEEESCESKEEREGQGDQIEPPTTVLSKGNTTEEEMRRDEDNKESDLVIMKEREIHRNNSQEGEKQMEDVKKEVEADGVKTSETSSKVAQDVVEVHNSTTETETVEQDFAVEGMDSRIEHEEADNDGRTVEAYVKQTPEECKGNKEEVRATNIDLIEPEVKVPSERMEVEANGQFEDKEIESATTAPHEFMEDETSKENLEEALDENCTTEPMNPGILPIKVDKEVDSIERQGKEICVEESEEEFEMEEEKELEDDLVKPQVNSVPETQELKGKGQADGRHVESEDAVTHEEFDMEEERELEDDLVEPQVKSIPEAQELKGKLLADDRPVESEGTVSPEEFEMEEERELEDNLAETLVKSIPKAQEIERKVHADDRHMEPEEVKDDLVEPKVKSTPEAQELERLIQADDRHMEPEDAVTQEEEFVIEDKKKVKNDFAEPQVKSVPEAQELEREVQADGRHMEPEDSVTQEEEFDMEDKREVKDGLAEPQVKNLPEAQELEREVQADIRHMESEDSVTQEEEFVMEDKREVKDDLAEPQMKSVPEAQELERELQADDRHMESEDSVTQEEEFVMEDKREVKDGLAEPQVKSIPEAQELEREVQADDGHMESEDSVTQEELDMEDKRKVKDDLTEPQVKNVPEAQELEREVQADNRHMEPEDAVTQEEEFDMEDKREVKDGLTEPQRKNVPEAQELEREVQSDIRHMEPEDAVTLGMTEKVVCLDEEIGPTKNVGDVPLRASNDTQPDTTVAQESDKIKDDQGGCDKEEINTELKETESQMSGIQENRQKELENNEEREQKNDIPPQRDIESLKQPELEQSPEMENEEEKAEGEACHEKMEEKERASDGEGREEVACDDKMEEKSGMEVQLKSMDIEGKTHAGEKESEMAVAMETIENRLRLEEKVEHEINNVPQRGNDKISPDFTTSKETDVECSDHGEQDVERRKKNDAEKKSEIGGASEIADKELKVVEELESDVNNMPQRDTENLEPDLPLSKERDIEENDHLEKDRKQVENQKEEQKTDRLRTSGAVSAMAGDEVDNGVKNEMEVEEKEGQMDCETVSPEKDDTGCHEGGDELSMATTTEEEKMVTSTEESVKDQGMRKEDDQEVDKELNSGKKEAAETVKEQVVEFGDHQNMDVQELPDLPLKDNKNPEQECNVDKSVAESEGEAKTREDKENKSNEGDRALESCEEATATEVSTAEDTVHSVVEDKGQDLETGKRSGGENNEGIKEICTKGNHNEDKESIHGAETELRNEDRESIHKAGTELRNEDKESIHSTETELGNELLKEKRVEEEMASSYNSMGDGDEVPLIVTKTDVEEKENNEIKPVDQKAEIEIIDEGIADEQENRCGIDKQTTFPDKMEKAENRTSGNLEGIQQLVMEEKVEVTGNVLNGSGPSIQEVDLQEKIELNVVDRKKTDARDGLKIMEEEELEEGEIPDDEEEREDDDKDDDKEEGEIMEEIEDVAEERGRVDEVGGKTQPLTEKSEDTEKNSEKEFSNSRKVEPARRRSQEAIEIAKTSSINSDLRTTRHVAERTMTTRSSAITMKRNFNGAYSSREHKRAKTIEPSDAIAVDDEDDDDVEVVESNIHPKKVSQSSHDKNSAEKDVYIIGEEPAKSAGAKPHDNRSNFSEHVSETSVNYEQNSEALSPKFGAGLKKVSPASSWHVGRKDKTGSNARRMVQSMKDHLLHNVSNSQESGENGQTVIKNSSCKAQGFKPKDSFAKEGRENLFKRLEGPGSGDAGTRTGKSGTKRKSDDANDDDNSGSSGSKTQPKKKLAGISGKEVWRMVPRKEKKPTEPIWEGNTKINRQKIVIKISKVHLPDQHGTKELEDNSKRKESEKSEKSSSHNGWKEGRKAEKSSEDKGCHEGLQANGVKEEQKEKREKTSLNVRDRRASSSSTDATGRWSAVPDAKLDNRTGSETGRKSRRASESNAKPDLIKDLKELKTHGIKQSDLPWVKDLLETDHTECLSEACAALTKFMDSKDHKINLVVEMGFCPMLVKLLRSRSAEVVSSALLAVSHIVSGNDYQTQAVLECSPLPLFSSFLSRHKHDVMLRKEACLALSNITAGTSQQIQHLVNDGLFPVLLSVMQHDEAQVMYEATWAVANATVNGSPEQIRYIVKQGFFQAFSEVLKHTDDTLIQIALDAMYNVLKLDAKNKKPGTPTPYCRQVKEFGGLERIRSVRQTGSTVVKKKADNMLRTFFCDL